MTGTRSEPKIAIIGGGPGGAVAALCLRKLGHEAVLFERDEFPRYRVGESLLPGTLSILDRLGLSEDIEAAGFPIKRAATFLWGKGERPWSFTFSTPKTAPWVYDHALQVTRAEFDKILLDAAIDRGTDVRIKTQVTDVDAGGPDQKAVITWKNGESHGEFEADYVIDASGAGSILARKHKLRKWDDYYKNMALWSYYKGGKRYSGDLEGNIFSVSFRDGWIWVIPQKDDMYSVGAVTGVEYNGRIKEIGPEAFFEECIANSEFVSETLQGAERVEEVRVVRDWAYRTDTPTIGRAFLCGDSACFIDPLFSQGVHLAAYSARMASASIDYFLNGGSGEVENVMRWFDDSYLAAYDRYHRFLSSFYFHCPEPDSTFWANRRIQGAEDERFGDQEWFTALAGQDGGIAELESRASVLRELWDHDDDELSEKFDETKLSLRRVKWAADLVRTMRGLAAVRWTGDRVQLAESYSVHPTSFALEKHAYLGSDGHLMAEFPLTAAHQQLFEDLNTSTVSYLELVKRLAGIEGNPAAPQQIIHRLFEDGFLQGYDEAGEPVHIEFAMRFGGVGSDDLI